MIAFPRELIDILSNDSWSGTVETKIQSRAQRRLFSDGKQRRGAVLPILPFLILASAGIAIMMIDMGHIAASRSRAQSAADASAIAGALMLRGQYENPDHAAIANMAIAFADLNEPEFANVLVQADVTLGDWDPYTNIFDTTTGHVNAVQTVIHVDTDVLFMSIFGGKGQHVVAKSIASFTVYEDSEPPFIDELTMPYLCNDEQTNLHQYGHPYANNGNANGNANGNENGGANGEANGEANGGSGGTP